MVENINELLNKEIFYDNEINFYEVDKEYIDYLFNFDRNVVKHKKNRKYIGIIFKFNNINYLAPLTSNKNNEKDYLNETPYKQVTFKIGKNEQNLGYIRFGNMIPVPNKVLKKVNFNQINDQKYRGLLIKQYIYLTSDIAKQTMKKLIQKTIKIAQNKNHYLHTVPGGICNIELLTIKAQSYMQ